MGRFRGGVRSLLDLEMEIDQPALADTAGDGIRHAPYGLMGGKDGRPHRYRLRSRNGRLRTLKTKEVGITVQPGDVFEIASAGGGGYGDEVRRGQPNAGGLVIASDQEHAHRIGELLRWELHVEATVVTSDDPTASERIASFATGTSPWLARSADRSCHAGVTSASIPPAFTANPTKPRLNARPRRSSGS